MTMAPIHTTVDPTDTSTVSDTDRPLPGESRRSSVFDDDDNSDSDGPGFCVEHVVVVAVVIDAVGDGELSVFVEKKVSQFCGEEVVSVDVGAKSAGIRLIRARGISFSSPVSAVHTSPSLLRA